MCTEMYINGEDKGDKKKIVRTCGIILWIIMIGIVMFLTFRSL